MTTCPLCGEPHELSQCPRWKVPSNAASLWLAIFAPWLKTYLTAWHLAVRTGAMFP